MLNEPQDRFALFSVEVEPRKKAVGEFNTLPCVLSAATAFASVMHQQGQQEQVEPVDFRQQLREPMFIVVRGLAQAVDVVDDEESVLVDGVAVIAIANYKRIDSSGTPESASPGRRARALFAKHERHAVQAALRAEHSTDTAPRGYE